MGGKVILGRHFHVLPPFGSAAALPCLWFPGGFEDGEVSLLFQQGANTRHWPHLCLFGDFQDSRVQVCHWYCKSMCQCCGMTPSMGMPAVQQIQNKTWAKMSVKKPWAVAPNVGTLGQLLCLPAGATWGVIFMWILECFPEVVFLHPTLFQTRVLVMGRKSNPKFWRWEVQSLKGCLSWVC